MSHQAFSFEAVLFSVFYGAESLDVESDSKNYLVYEIQAY